MNALNFARPESQLAFTADEQLAYEAKGEVMELDLEQFKGIACCNALEDGKVFHWSLVKAGSVNLMTFRHYKTNQKYLLVDRWQLGSKSSARFQLQTADHEQKVVGLFRNLDDVRAYRVENGII